MLKNELLEKHKSLKQEITQLEKQVEPIMLDLQKKRDTLIHVEALLATEPGETIIPLPEKDESINWAQLCRNNGWPLCGNSGHRVVKKMDSKLHASIPHTCIYEGNRTYP